ncbi:MAG: hypothetical protein B7Z66_08845 [Chromatiales bacterium 21-64-14]|nr:MAG: hypothetical protein B7Z66_08845 [Chromatiales bacterium 21-64-14]HQU16111.1 hypothetical protein [Gammaproteobacteria bacterium]
MFVDYYAIRRMNPYLGVLQVVDTGEARAYSSNGRRWQVRNVEGTGWREAAGAEDGDDAGLSAHSDAPEDIMAALERRPPIPFRFGDRYELWLLHRETLAPLALLQSRRWRYEVEPVRDPTWRPFMLGDAGFPAPAIGSVSNSARHRGLLERQVNLAARPRPVAQWFERHTDGSGTGLSGLRVGEERVGRRIAAPDFPELLVDERWETELQGQLVAEYHHWNAPLLLTHQNLARATRVRLEEAARRSPRRLLDIWPLIPEVLDSDAMRVALVAARLMRA